MKTAGWVLAFVSVIVLIVASFGHSVPQLIEADRQAKIDEALRDIGYNFTLAISGFEDQCREDGNELSSVTFFFTDGDILSARGTCTVVNSADEFRETPPDIQALIDRPGPWES